MDATLHALGGLLLRAVPTFVLVVVLHFYLKGMFFRPLEKVLQQRYEATKGARKLAEQSLEKAAAKTAEYEAAIRAARAKVYQDQEKLHKQLQEQEASELTAARGRAEAAVQAAKEELGRDVREAKAGLDRESEMLANKIADSILRSAA
jgi:F-type H+-transporting ATPase subunit b